HCQGDRQSAEASHVPKPPPRGAPSIGGLSRGTHTAGCRERAIRKGRGKHKPPARGWHETWYRTRRLAEFPLQRRGAPSRSPSAQTGYVSERPPLLEQWQRELRE